MKILLFPVTYGIANRLAWLEYPYKTDIAHRTDYAYDGDGFLAVIRKFENSSLVDEVRIVRDGFLAIQDRDENNAVEREYTWGLNLGGGIGGLLNLKQGCQDYAYLYDGKGNVAAVLDGSQAVVAAYRYAPFGGLLAQTGSLTQPFGFSTKRYNAQTGLIYYGYRFYEPEISRWLTRDPLGEAGGMNLYAFVGNNPVNWVDPWGLYRSHWLLRALVPGQISWDNAVTAFQNENYGGAALYTAAMLGEQLLVAYMWGQASALIQGSSTLPGAIDSICAADSPAIPIIKGTQKGLRNPALVEEIMSDMLNDLYRYSAPEGIIGGYVDSKGIYYVSEGHHRMAAAMRIYKNTGNVKPILQLIKHGLWSTINKPPASVYSIH